MIEKCFWALLFLLLVSVKSTNGIKCYHCIAPWKEGDCVQTGGYGKLVDCDSSDAKGWKEAVASTISPFFNLSMKGWDEQSPNACVKLTYTSNHPAFSTNTTLTTRTCMVAVPIPHSQSCTNPRIKSAITAQVLSDDGLKSYTRNLETCICTDNLCNGSQSTIAALFFVALTAATSIAIAKFLP